MPHRLMTLAVEDVGEPVSLIAYHLADEFGHVDGVSGAVTGSFRTTEPFPVEIDLNGLR